MPSTGLLVSAPLNIVRPIAAVPPQHLPPALMLLSSFHLARAIMASSGGQARTIKWDVMASGAFISSPNWPKPITIDLATTVPMPLLHIAPKNGTAHAHLHLFRVVLDNLAVAPLSLEFYAQYVSRQLPATYQTDDVVGGLGLGGSTGQVPANAWDGEFHSALPLWFCDRPSLGRALAGNYTYVHHINIGMSIIMLPLPDFTALLSAALRGPEWKTGAVVTERLMRGISLFEVNPNYVPKMAPNSQVLFITAFQGW